MSAVKLKLKTLNAKNRQGLGPMPQSHCRRVQCEMTGVKKRELEHSAHAGDRLHIVRTTRNCASPLIIRA